MKTITNSLKTNRIFIFLFGLIFLFPFSSKSQEECLSSKFEDNCTSLLSSIFDDYLYLKSRAFSSKENIDVEFQVTLKRNILYIFNVCQGPGTNSMILNLIDGKNKIVATSFNSKTKKNDKIISFRPEAAGKYYISTFFEKKDENCCLIMFGMIKKNIEQYLPVSTH